MDLALAYTIIGYVGGAARCVSAALQLGKENRFIIRSAARYLIHKDHSTDAHKLLANSQIAKHDPWVMAAEIACSQAAKKGSKFAKKAQQLLNKEEIDPKQLTELASALGSLELLSGGYKKGRKLIETSLIAPSENSIAQASWLLQQNHVDLDESNLFNFNSSYEATTWNSYRKGDLSNSAKASLDWLKDQPFSSRPAIHSSFLSACVFEEHEKAVKYCKEALICNPKNATLTNNLVYSLLKLNRVTEALDVIQKTHGKIWKDRDIMVWGATIGLFNYKIGNFEEGDLYYEDTISYADKNNLTRLGNLARLFHALEKLEVAGKSAEKLVKKVIVRSEKTKDASEKVLLNRLVKNAQECGINVDLKKEINVTM